MKDKKLCRTALLITGVSVILTALILATAYLAVNSSVSTTAMLSVTILIALCTCAFATRDKYKVLHNVLHTAIACYSVTLAAVGFRALVLYNTVEGFMVLVVPFTLAVVYIVMDLIKHREETRK